MIQIVQGFKVSTRDAIDNRIVLTKEEMRLINDNQMPDVYFAICKEDSKLYIYNKNVNIDPETGKFSLYSSSTISSISINGQELPIDAGNVDLPTATAERCGMVLPSKGLKIEGDGVLSLDFNSLDDASIPFEKINWEDVIISGDKI